MGFWEQPSHSCQLSLDTDTSAAAASVGRIGIFCISHALKRLLGLTSRLRKPVRLWKNTSALPQRMTSFAPRLHKLRPSLRELLTQLPKRREIPDLIRQISDRGAYWLANQFVAASAGAAQGVLCRNPHCGHVVGPYHAVGLFDALGQMSRIVSVSNIQMAMNAKT